MNDDNVNSYFSKAILFVEGSSETELFSNPYLKRLFPVLTLIDVFEGTSNDKMIETMLPSKVNTNIPFYRLIDMDKFLDFSSKSKFTIQSKYMKMTKRSVLRTYHKKATSNNMETSNGIVSLYKRINKMTENLCVHRSNFWSCDDIEYKELIKAIRDYLVRLDTLVFQSTVEGALINSKNIDVLYDYIKYKLEREFADDLLTLKAKVSELDQIKLALSRYSLNERANILRALYLAKSDLFKKIDCILSQADTLSGHEIDIIKGFKIKEKQIGLLTI